MKVAFQVEGGVDLRVLKSLVATLLGQPIEGEVYPRRAGGIDATLRSLEQAVWSAWARGCVGVVVGVDADASTPHSAHADGPPGDCRLCRILRDLPAPLPARPPLPALRYAIAVPVQAIEAWLLHFGYYVERRSPGPPQLLDRHAAKRLLRRTMSPTEGNVSAVCDAILPHLTPTDLDALAVAQPSFAEFRSALLAWTAS